MKNSDNTQIQTSKPPRLHMVVIIVCSVLTAAIMLFSPKSLWGASENTSNNTGSDGKVVALSTATNTSQNTDENRQSNIAQACKALNGRTIQPNETFSMNSVIGNVSDNATYLIAPVVQDGVGSTERGGGVSQVVSAFYHAAACAGMRIDEHHAHAIAVDFTPLGFDATVSYGTLDLLMTNTTGTELTIDAQSEGSTVTISIYGTQDAKKTSYALSSTVTDSYVKNVLGTDRLYYTITTSRVKYENGVFVDTETIDSNTYEAVDVAFTVSPISGT